jgi:hypothetical protein
MSDEIKNEKTRAIESLLVGLTIGEAQYLLDLVSQHLHERAILQS